MCRGRLSGGEDLLKSICIKAEAQCLHLFNPGNYWIEVISKFFFAVDIFYWVPEGIANESPGRHVLVSRITLPRRKG